MCWPGSGGQEQQAEGFGDKRWQEGEEAGAIYIIAPLGPGEASGNTGWIY